MRKSVTLLTIQLLICGLATLGKQAQAAEPEGSMDAIWSDSASNKAAGSKVSEPTSALCPLSQIKESELVKNGGWPGIGPFKDKGGELVDADSNRLKLETKQNEVTAAELHVTAPPKGFINLEMTADFLLESVGAQASKIADFNSQLEKEKAKLPTSNANSPLNLSAGRFLVCLTCATTASQAPEAPADSKKQAFVIRVKSSPVSPAEIAASSPLLATSKTVKPEAIAASSSPPDTSKAITSDAIAEGSSPPAPSKAVRPETTSASSSPSATSRSDADTIAAKGNETVYETTASSVDSSSRGKSATSQESNHLSESPASSEASKEVSKEVSKEAAGQTEQASKKPDKNHSRGNKPARKRKVSVKPDEQVPQAASTDGSENDLKPISSTTNGTAAATSTSGQSPGAEPAVSVEQPSPKPANTSAGQKTYNGWESTSDSSSTSPDFTITKPSLKPQAVASADIHASSPASLPVTQPAIPPVTEPANPPATQTASLTPFKPSSPADLKSQFQSLVESWQKIKRVAVKDKDSTQLSLVLAGKTLQRQTDAVKWLTDNHKYYDMTPKGVVIQRYTSLIKDQKYLVNAQVQEESKYMDEATNQVIKNSDDTYIVNYTIEKVGDHWMITDSAIVDSTIKTKSAKGQTGKTTR